MKLEAEVTPKEIMIGNWLIGSNNGFEKEVQIYAFDNEHIQHTDYMAQPLDYSHFSPIPLTEEILLKCGFLKTAPLVFVIHGFMIELKMGSRYSVSIIKDGVKTWIVEYHYLHQLQNLFHALTGKELNVKL